VQKDIDVLEAQLKDIESRPALSESVEAILTKNEEYATTKQKVSEILVPEAIQQPDTTELQNRKTTLQDHINQLFSVLASKDMITANDSRRKELEAQEKEYAQQIASMEKIEYQIETFVKRKVSEVEKRVNALFPTVRFRMFNVQVNGGEEPACECLVNGVPYNDCNSAHKTLSGLEIISVFSKIHDLYAPCFIDNSEGINNIPKMDFQVIKMYVTEDKELTVIV